MCFGLISTDSIAQDDGEADSDDATKIHEAMKGWGTDEGPLIDILSKKTNAQRQDLKEKYKEKYDKVIIIFKIKLPYLHT